jgi:hypothetical protein
MPIWELNGVKLERIVEHTGNHVVIAFGLFGELCHVNCVFTSFSHVSCSFFVLAAGEEFGLQKAIYYRQLKVPD